MNEVYGFLKKSKIFYLATMEGDQPRVRPFGTINLFENKLYIQTGKSKKVAKQMNVNPKIEISAMHKNEWIRIQAIAVEDDRLEPKVSMFNSYPSLKEIYSATDDNTQVLYLKDVVATIFSFDKPPIIFNF